MKPIIFTLTGPSCAGKTTLEKLLVEKHGFSNVISDTTRPIRAGEVDGVNYYYRTEAEFNNVKELGLLIESVTYGGYQYGISLDEVNRVTATGKVIVAVVEPNGREQIKKYANKAKFYFVPIFISNPANIIAQRYMRRIIDGAITLDPFALKRYEEFLQTSSSRLADMMTVEAAWVQEAKSVLNPYILVFHNFNETNQEYVLKRIDDYAKMLIGNRDQAESEKENKAL